MRRKQVSRIAILTISLGSGQNCDATYLFSTDLLGENRGHIPRHAKVYRKFAQERDRLQQERIAAYREFIDDISRKDFPDESHSVSIGDQEFENFVNSIS
ncbi:MAG: 3-methyl-2-oxobutanoate hydroxymethyltransferase [Gammaproteobacteria bacterium]|nr:3-methyl-2-oxobutanoate hydroxymethyltransferase [Gammaproteobacteria bacterium]